MPKAKPLAEWWDGYCPERSPAPASLERVRLPACSSGQLFLVNKSALIKKVIQQLASELELYHKAARAAHAEATHEQSKAENKYDTRGLEASYLARGQSRQAAEIIQAIEQFERLPAKSFSETDAIDLSALVELQSNSERFFYFIGPRAGGTEFIHEKKGDPRDYTPITPWPANHGKENRRPVENADRWREKQLRGGVGPMKRTEP